MQRMADKADINFDRELRAKLLGGVEPVGEGLWAGVLERRAAAARRKVAVLWWRRGAIGLSAAAAVALGVFLMRPGQIREPVPGKLADVSVVSVEETLPPAVQAETLPAEIPAAKAEPVHVVASPRRSLIAMAETARQEAVAAESADSETAAPVADETAPVTPAAENVLVPSAADDVFDLSAASGDSAVTSAAENSAEAEPVDVFIPSEPFAKPRRASSWAITASGNIQNNKSEGSASGAMRSASNSDNGSVVNDLGDKNFGIPLTFGVGVIKTFPSGLGIGTGVNYSLLPRTFRGTYNPEDGEGFEADINERQHFIGIPLNIFYEVVSTKHFAFHVFAGGEGEKLISRNFTITREGASPINYSEGARGLQWSVGGGIGMEIKITRHLGIYLDPGVRYYFNCAQPASIRTVQPFMFNLEAGLRVDL